MWGPRLWAELHRSAGPNVLPGFLQRIPCLYCAATAVELVLDDPPTKGMSLEAWRRWTWRFHNRVSAACDPPKPEVEYAAAAERWGWTREGSD